jgi:hypothetical protein
MAKPIKETPILTSMDAVNFFRQMKEAETKKISQSELDRMRISAERIKKLEQ